MNKKDVELEVWVVEVPGVILQCFGENKDAALAFAKEHGKDAVIWDMMKHGPTEK